jgi:hypothetical protein
VEVVRVGRRDNVVKTYVSEETLADLDRFAEDADKSRAEIVRQAIREYTDRDRFARLESLVRENNRLLRGEGEDKSHSGRTHTQKQTASKTVQRTRDIARRLQENHDGTLKDDTVERAIEDIAGGDARTIEKYKRNLKRRGLLFAHPQSPVWTHDRAEWVGWVESYADATPDASVLDMIDPYPYDHDEYSGFVKEVQP